MTASGSVRARVRVRARAMMSLRPSVRPYAGTKRDGGWSTRRRGVAGAGTYGTPDNVLQIRASEAGTSSA